MEIKILISFSESSYRDNLIYNFKEDSNYHITYAETAHETLSVFQNKDFDIVLLDMHYMDGNGLELKKKMNDIKDVPTIFVTNINDDIQKVLALEYGADDYVVFPFNVLELKARIRAVLRRTYKGIDRNNDSFDKENVITFENYEFNVVGRKVKINGEDIDLTGKEFDIFFILVSNPGVVYSRVTIAKEIWGDNYEGHLRTVDVHIKRLREKIDDLEGHVIRTKWGKGYYFGKLEE